MSQMSNAFPLKSLYLYLTDTCNLRCSHCWIAPRFSENRKSGIPFEPLKKTIREAESLGLQGVKLTGGEPLLYRLLEELIRFLHSRGLEIYMETNGTLFSKTLLDVFKAARVAQISVSLDAAEAEVHDAIRGVPGGFQRTCEGLRLLSDTGLNVQIIMTLQQRNRWEIPGMIALCEKLNAGSLKINPTIPCGRGQGVFDRKENLELEDLMGLYRQVEKDKQRVAGLEIIFDLPLAFRSIGEITERGVCECEIRNILGILANGDYSICGIGQIVPELRMGNIVDDAIEQVWRKSPVLTDLRRSLPGKLGGICRDCIFKFQCLGECRANAYVLSKNLYAPSFFCQSLFDKNQFPPSRHFRSEADS